MIRYAAKGLSFLLKYAELIDSPSGVFQEGKIQTEDGKMFRSKLLFSGPNSPTVYIQHGMSARGIDDPRILTLATHIKNSGANVFLPELPEIQGLRVSTETVPNIRGLFRSIADRVGGPISFLSASFSAGMGMVALSGPEEQHLLKACLLVGGYSDFSHTLPFTLSNYESDPYAVHVLLYNFIGKMRPDLKDLEEFYFETALDNGLHRSGSEEKGPFFWEGLGTEEKDFVSRVRTDSNFRKDLAIGILENLPPNFILSNSPNNFLEAWNSPLALLHGFDDPVISPDESENLYSSLLSLGREETVLLKSRLITHGDHLPFYTQLGEIPKLAGLWGFFLKKTGL